jgi:hypothetical protein
MTTYTIDDDIPVPEPRRSKTGAPRRAITPWTQTIDRLRPGQSSLCVTWSDYKAADQFRTRRPERKYVIRKIGGQGWRVWRVE